MKKKMLAGFVSGVLSLFLAITLLAGSLCGFGYATVCQPSVLVKAVEASGFSQELYEEIKYNWENLLAITGVMKPDSIMAVLTPQGVQEDVVRYLQNAYSGSGELDTAKTKEQLETKIRDYAYSNNIHATPESELEQNIRDLVSACMADYHQAVKLPLLPKLLGAVSGVAGYLKMGIYVMAAGSLFLAVFLFFLQRKRRNILYFAAVSTATNAVLLLGLLTLVQHYDVVNRLPFEASAVKTLLVYYLQTLLSSLHSVGVAFLGSTAVLILGYAAAAFVAGRKEKSAKKGEDTLDHSDAEDIPGRGTQRGKGAAG